MAYESSIVYTLIICFFITDTALSDKGSKPGNVLIFLGKSEILCNLKSGRAKLRHEWAGLTGVIPRPHRKPTRNKACVVFRSVGG
uniref:SFRICE_009926 n=1 Tax=Spodoptera frugiperda TaxID=7108 RepID=A0A2H1WVJ0_SPOFR